MKTIPKLAFAHYMMCNRSYGGSVAGYKIDVCHAKSIGLDGFALNTGGWNDSNYKHDIATMFEAAQAISPDGSFKLFFSADMTGLSFPETVLMMQAYASHPNYLRVEDKISELETEWRPVLSSWGGEGGGWAAAKSNWQTLVLDPLKAVGIHVFFVPFFFTVSEDGKSYYTPPTSDQTQAQIDNMLKGLVDGVLYGESIDCPGLAQNASNESFASQVKAAGLLTMAFVSPSYWGSRQISAGRRFMDHRGGEGLALQMESIVANQNPDWIELFTWNDFDEHSYFSPIDDVNNYWAELANKSLGFYHSHAGFWRLMRYLILRWKTGVFPVIKHDVLMYFYRTQDANLVPSADSFGPVTWRTTDDNSLVENILYVTCLLAAPATLTLRNWDGGIQSVDLAAGLVHARFNIYWGGTFLDLVRNGSVVLTSATCGIDHTATEANFGMFTGYAEVT